MTQASMLVDGEDYNVTIGADCRTGYCRHNEDTDMIAWNGALWVVHRSAVSQQLGPNSALHVYASTDDGKSFHRTALIPAPSDRDIRDPSFFVVGGKLVMKALERLPGSAARDTGVDTLSVIKTSADGKTWSGDTLVSPHGWAFWRVKENAGVWYSAAYDDGDNHVVLFQSHDGVAWTQGPQIYGVTTDIPSETELTFMPSGKMLALVRLGTSDSQLLGDAEPLRTKICWADPPAYASFSCPQEFDTERLDGPLSFWWKGRLFVIARKHLVGTGKKRTSLYEIGGTLEGGPLTIKEWGELPSAGDTAYAGIAMTDATHAVASWYSGDIVADRPWILGVLDPTNIWLGTIDFSKLQ
jgi:hypothetical protein